MTDTKMMTAWAMNRGYERIEMPEEYLRYETSDLALRSCEEAREATCWEYHDSQFDMLDTLTVQAYRHRETRAFHVDVSGGDCGLPTIYVAAEDADAFFATEYLLMVQRAKAVQQADGVANLAKAFQAFIRFGHGESTISEFGTTKDEARNEQARRRALEERQRREKQQSGS